MRAVIIHRTNNKSFVYLVGQALTRSYLWRRYLLGCLWQQNTRREIPKARSTLYTKRVSPPFFTCLPRARSVVFFFLFAPFARLARHSPIDPYSHYPLRRGLFELIRFILLLSAFVPFDSSLFLDNSDHLWNCINACFLIIVSGSRSIFSDFATSELYIFINKL